MRSRSEKNGGHHMVGVNRDPNKKSSRDNTKVPLFGQREVEQSKKMLRELRSLRSNNRSMLEEVIRCILRIR